MLSAPGAEQRLCGTRPHPRVHIKHSSPAFVHRGLERLAALQEGGGSGGRVANDYEMPVQTDVAGRPASTKTALHRSAQIKQSMHKQHR